MPAVSSPPRLFSPPVVLQLAPLGRKLGALQNIQEVESAAMSPPQGSWGAGEVFRNFEFLNFRSAPVILLT